MSFNFCFRLWNLLKIFGFELNWPGSFLNDKLDFVNTGPKTWEVLFKKLSGGVDSKGEQVMNYLSAGARSDHWKCHQTHENYYKKNKEAILKGEFAKIKSFQKKRICCSPMPKITNWCIPNWSVKNVFWSKKKLELMMIMMTNKNSASCSQFWNICLKRGVESRPNKPLPSNEMHALKLVKTK